jgi:hypothetical protein
MRTQSSSNPTPAPALHPPTIAHPRCVHPLTTYTRATCSYPFHSKLIAHLRSGDVPTQEQRLHREDLPPRIMVRGRGGNMQLCQRSLSYTLRSDRVAGICGKAESWRVRFRGRRVVRVQRRRIPASIRYKVAPGSTQSMRWQRVDVGEGV